MRLPRNARNRKKYRKDQAIITTILDLVAVLGKLTSDDRLVLLAVKSIFASHDVRLAHSAIPVRLVDATPSNGNTLIARMTRRRSIRA